MRHASNNNAFASSVAICDTLSLSSNEKSSVGALLSLFVVYISPGKSVSSKTGHEPPSTPIKCATHPLSFFNSSSDFLILSRNQSLIFSPSTISYDPSRYFYRIEKTNPSSMPYGLPSVMTALENQSPSSVGVTKAFIASAILTAVDAAEDRPHFLISKPPLV